jgi:non-haem Fe2+, alpha-ketoglutarate-dependent halogenase
MSEQAMTNAVTASFAEHGFATGIRVFSEEEAKDYRAKVESALASFEKPTNVMRQIHLFLPWALELARKPEIINPVSAVLGKDVILKGGMVLVKSPQSPSVVMWHSDHAYTDTGISPQVSAWVALSPSFPENGCMKVVPGSHRQVHEHHEVRMEGHQLKTNLTVVQQPDPNTVKNLQLEPGQMSLHDPIILHSSGPNITDIPRIGFIIRYVTPEFAANDAPMVRIKGDAPCPHLNLMEPAFADTYEACVEKMIAFNARFSNE